MSEQYDAIIIGAGMSGLSAGIRLAHFGKRVAIVEKHYLWGGLNSFYRKGGYLFDVGLHAMTNYPLQTKNKRAPLKLIARQLRLDLEQFHLQEQKHSLIHFPEHKLTFSNKISLLENEIAQNFPTQIDGFQELVEAVSTLDIEDKRTETATARPFLEHYLTDARLVEMILCPILYYGSASEHDLSLRLFAVLFQAIFVEGLCRPEGGIRQVLDVLVHAFKQRGGELKLRTPVEKIIAQEEQVIVQTEIGEELRARCVLSSAGLVETHSLLGNTLPNENSVAGKLSFVETIYCLKRSTQALDIVPSNIFFSRVFPFRYQQSESLVDYDSAILSCPGNYLGANNEQNQALRMTHLANYDQWKALHNQDSDKYQRAKDELCQEQLKLALSIVPDFSGHIQYQDTFTPITIEKFTSHRNGAVYGSPNKVFSGEIGVPNVYLCGTDQGYLGIVGALLSGILMANQHALR